MDNIDGKQARRTGSSSPLGELFEFVPRYRVLETRADFVIATELTRSTAPWVTSATSHALGFRSGTDSLKGSLLETASMGLGSTPIGAYTALFPCLPMFFSTWETYHTHVLYLGHINGPTGRLPAPGLYGDGMSDGLQREL